MSLNKALLAEFDHEVIGTRHTLERVPEDKFDWAPHPKSAKMGNLAKHVAELPTWVNATIEKDGINFAGYVPEPAPKNRKELLAFFDKNVTAARASLVAATDEAAWTKPWSLANGDTVIFTMPKSVVMRTFVFNHIVHHRAQLGVYLRLNDVPLPAIYGPSADENKF